MQGMTRLLFVMAVALGVVACSLFAPREPLNCVPQAEPHTYLCGADAGVPGEELPNWYTHKRRH